MERETVDLIESLIAAEPEERRGAFRWGHHSVFVRWRHRVPIPNEDQWMTIGPALHEGSSNSDERVLALLRKHPWTIGRLGWMGLAERFWNGLAGETRAAFLAGLSNGLRGELDEDPADPRSPEEWHEKTRRFALFIRARLDDVTLDPISGCELAVNITLARGGETVTAILSRPGVADGHVARRDPHDDRDWDELIAPLSERVADIVLEIALKTKNEGAVRAALTAGADPDMAVWNLEGSYNERFCALAYAVDYCPPAIAQALLDSGASPAGTEYGGLNQPLFYALHRGYDDLADHLLAQGATFAISSVAARELADAEAAGQRRLLSPRHIFQGARSKERDAIRKMIGTFIPLVPASQKPSEYIGNGQGGQRTTWLAAVVGDNDNLARLRKYEARGLDTRLAAEEVCAIVQADGWNCLCYLLGKYGVAARDRAFFRIRRKYPAFGAVRREFETRPQKDAINLFAGDLPAERFAWELPNGIKVHVWLEAIGPAVHRHGLCLPDEIFVEEVEAIFRRRKEQIVMSKLARKWVRVRVPENNAQLFDLLPCVLEVDGRRIWLGMNLGRFRWSSRDSEIRRLLDEWFDSAIFAELMILAGRRILEQQAANRRPPSPTLNEDELKGYPREFWPYLTRLPNALIGMTEESCFQDEELLARYRFWENENKPDSTFVPDPRLLSWEGWNKVPEELKPFFIIDTLFDRPGVRQDAANEYEKAMIGKVARWWNEEWMIPAILPLLESKGCDDRESK